MSNIEPLAEEWLALKKAEAQAAAKRKKIEDQLIAALGAKEEGAQTHEVGPYKVTVTGKLTRSMDAVAWDSVKGRIPESMWPVKTSVSVDSPGVKYLQNNEPDMWKAISIAFETKPAKTAVTVKEF